MTEDSVDLNSHNLAELVVHLLALPPPHDAPGPGLSERPAERHKGEEQWQSYLVHTQKADAEPQMQAQHTLSQVCRCTLLVRGQVCPHPCSSAKSLHQLLSLPGHDVFNSQRDASFSSRLQFPALEACPQ